MSTRRQLSWKFESREQDMLEYEATNDSLYDPHEEGEDQTAQKINAERLRYPNADRLYEGG